jgi:hypothetical protein
VPDRVLPELPELRNRISAEFDRMGTLLASGTLEERRVLVACYVQTIRTEPEEETVVIGLLPGLLSQVVEHAERSSSSIT